MGIFGFGRGKKTAADDALDKEEKGKAKADPQESPDMEKADLQESPDTQAGDLQEDLETEEEGDNGALSFYNMAEDAMEQGDEEAAFRLYTSAARKGCAPAQFELGQMMESGFAGHDADPVKAAQWYQKAADQGDSAAQFNLGYLCYNNFDKKEEGLAWIQKAAAAGDEAAQEFIRSLQVLEKRRADQQRLKANLTSWLRHFTGHATVYFIISNLTRMPYIEENPDNHECRVYLFSLKDSAQTFVRKMLEAKGHPLSIREVAHKDLLEQLARLYPMGVSSMHIDDEGNEYETFLYELVKRRDFSKIPENKRPIENPDLLRNMLYFIEEFRRTEKNPDMDYRRKLDRDMTMLLQSGRFILPVFREKNGAVKYLLMKNPQTRQSLIPVFTDNFALNDLPNRPAGLQYMVTDFDHMMSFTFPADANGFVVDPAGLALPLLPAFFKAVAELRKRTNV